LQGKGVAGYYDVMRGEETALLGAMDWVGSARSQQKKPLYFGLAGTQLQMGGKIKTVMWTQFSTVDYGRNCLRGLQ